MPLDGYITGKECYCVKISNAYAECKMIDHFTIHEVFHDQLQECEDGDSLALWTKPEVDLIYAYRSGTVNGQGKVVTISKHDNPKLVEMLDIGWSVDLTLIKKGTILKFESPRLF